MEYLTNKTILILSFWGYPFGGGEEYLYQTAFWSINMGMNCYWISFSTSNNECYDNLEIEKIDGFYIIRVPGGFNETNIYNWIKLINPDIIHHQGHLRENFYKAISQLKIEFITGIHFWNGIIQLDVEHKNINILKHHAKHKPDPEFYRLLEEPYCHFYVVSKFVQEAVEQVTHHHIEDIAYSGSSKSKCLVKHIDPIKNKYVVAINIHKLKGGDLILYLLKTLKDVSFFVIVTEGASESLDEEIRNEIDERNKKGYAQSVYSQRVSDMIKIYQIAKIFLAPSLVDETFCRTVNEAMMNGIPVITSGQGNLKYLVKDSEFVINMFQDNYMELWAGKIEQLYKYPDQFKRASKIMLSNYEDHSEEKCFKTFRDLVIKILKKSKAYNIMLYTPWCDQGLGIQSRNYYNILVKNGFNVFVLSYKPYIADSTLELQKNPNEWIIPNVYYSPNDREHVKDIEILNFIKEHNIGKCLIPETCWYRVFEIAKLLKDNNIKCYAVPNIEIVRKDEIIKHNYFHKILCNNFLCQQVFTKANVLTNEYVGYGIFDNIQDKKKSYDGLLKFLFIGGMNAFSRKHIIEICESFALAYDINSDISLTCTIQKTNLLEIEDKEKIYPFFNHPGINFIQEHLPYSEILNLYHEHHISIQVSKHEGLGLGFYESLATGTPIITLDTSPHNELVKDGVNGYVIPCYYQSMTDNNDSFIESAYFDTNDLSEVILDLADNSDDLEQLWFNTLKYYNDYLSPNHFIKRFIKSIS